MTDLEFRCPKCGSRSFGSAYEDGMEKPPTRYCHGRKGHRVCGFTWAEKNDWKYFMSDGERLTKEAYEAIMKKMRETPISGTSEIDGPNL